MYVCVYLFKHKSFCGAQNQEYGKKVQEKKKKKRPEWQWRNGNISCVLLRRKTTKESQRLLVESADRFK